MARNHLPSSMLLLVILAAVGVVPALYALQVTVHRARQDQARVVADVVVRLNDAAGSRWVGNLEPTAGPGGGIALWGTTVLRNEAFPWNPTPLEAQLALVLDPSAVRPGAHPVGSGSPVQAWYRERLAEGGSAVLRVPCQGLLDVARVQGDVGEGGWARVRELQGWLELSCRGFGADLVWGSGDDLVWALEGQFGRRWGAQE